MINYNTSDDYYYSYEIDVHGNTKKVYQSNVFLEDLISDHETFSDIERLEDLLLELNSPILCFLYARDFLKNRFLEGEPIIYGDSSVSYLYYEHVYSAYTPPHSAHEYYHGERSISESPMMSYMYACFRGSRFVRGEVAIARLDLARVEDYFLRYMTSLGTRWIEAEDVIKTSPSATLKYCLHLELKFVWELEVVISQDAESSYRYAEFIGQPFPLGESAISTCPFISCSYATKILQGRFPLGEDSISRNSDTSLKYAINALCGEFPAGESSIATNARNSLSYATIIGKRFPEGEAEILKDKQVREAYFDYLKGLNIKLNS